MKKSKNKILLGLVASSLAIVVLFMWQATNTAQPHVSRIANQAHEPLRNRRSILADWCSGRPTSDGFTKYVASGRQQLVFRGGLNKPACRIVLQPGAKLDISGELTTGKLIISDFADSRQPSTVRLVSLKLSGQSDAGLQISLHAPGSHLTVEHSQLNYPLSVGLAVGNGDSDLAAALKLTDSKIISSRSTSEGIVLTSTGQAMVSRSVFEPPPGDSVLLLASTCRADNNLGSILGCKQ